MEAGVEGHDDFFEGGIAGAFAEAVDGHGEGGCAGLIGGEGVGGGEAEVIVAVEFEEEVGETLMQGGNGGVGLQGVPCADGIGDSEAKGAGIGGGVGEVLEKCGVGAGGVQGANGDVDEMFASLRHQGGKGGKNPLA